MVVVAQRSLQPEHHPLQAKDKQEPLMGYFMKKNIHHVRDLVFAGLVFLVVLFALVLLLHKVWEELYGHGS